MSHETVRTDFPSSLSDLDLVQHLLADLHNDLPGKLQRSRQIVGWSDALGSSGTMLFGGETNLAAWREARWSFIHGNFTATVMLCQALVENLLAAFLHGGLMQDLPARISFSETLARCQNRNIITAIDAQDLKRLMELRNPLSHFRALDDASNLSRRILDTMMPAEEHLLEDAEFALQLAIRIMALPSFRLGP